MHGHYILDRGRNLVPVTPQAWLAWRTANDGTPNQVLAKTALDNGEAFVSTVFTGLNVGVGQQPQCFETMIVGGDYDGKQWAWHTWTEASEGHDKVVEGYYHGDWP